MLLHELRGIDRILLRIERAVLRQDVLCGDAEADELPPGDIRFIAAVGEYLSPGENDGQASLAVQPRSRQQPVRRWTGHIALPVQIRGAGGGPSAKDYDHIALCGSRLKYFRSRLPISVSLTAEVIDR